MILNKERVILAKAEATPGTYETPASATDAVPFFDPSFNEVKEAVERKPHFNKLTAGNSLIGKHVFELGFSVELNPDILKSDANYFAVLRALFNACLMEETAIVNSPGENGYQHDVISAGDTQHTVSLEYYEGGRKYELKACKGDFTISGEVGDVLLANFTFQGLEESVSSDTMPSVTYTETPAPVMNGATCTIADITLTPVTSFELAMNNTINERPDFREADGVIGFIGTAMAPKISLDPEATQALGDAIDTLIDARTEKAISVKLNGVSETSAYVEISGNVVPNQYSREDREDMIAYGFELEITEPTITLIEEETTL
jgi:hypothetical protein